MMKEAGGDQDGFADLVVDVSKEGKKIDGPNWFDFEELDRNYELLWLITLPFFVV